MYRLLAYNTATQQYDIPIGTGNSYEAALRILNILSRFYHDIAVLDQADNIILIREVLDERNTDTVMDLIPPIHIG